MYYVFIIFIFLIGNIVSTPISPPQLPEPEVTPQVDQTLASTRLFDEIDSDPSIWHFVAIGRNDSAKIGSVVVFYNENGWRLYNTNISDWAMPEPAMLDTLMNTLAELRVYSISETFSDDDIIRISKIVSNDYVAKYLFIIVPRDGTSISIAVGDPFSDTVVWGVAIINNDPSTASIVAISREDIESITNSIDVIIESTGNEF